MDKTQCVHVFEITRSRCLSCGGRTRLDRITRRKELLGSLKGTEVKV